MLYINIDREHNKELYSTHTKTQFIKWVCFCVLVDIQKERDEKERKHKICKYLRLFYGTVVEAKESESEGERKIRRRWFGLVNSLCWPRIILLPISN